MSGPSMCSWSRRGNRQPDRGASTVWHIYVEVRVKGTGRVRSWEPRGPGAEPTCAGRSRVQLSGAGGLGPWDTRLRPRWGDGHVPRCQGWVSGSHEEIGTGAQTLGPGVWRMREGCWEAQTPPKGLVLPCTGRNGVPGRGGGGWVVKAG